MLLSKYVKNSQSILFLHVVIIIYRIKIILINKTEKAKLYKAKINSKTKKKRNIFKYIYKRILSLFSMFDI